MTIQPNTVHVPLSERISACRGFILDYALKLTHEPNDAEDLTQDVLLKALVAQHQYRQDDNLHGWLHRITYTTFVTEHRRRKVRDTPLVRDDLDTGLLAYDQAVQYLDENAAEVGLLKADVDAVLKRLTYAYRRLYQLRLLGYSYGDLANVFGIEVSVVATRLHRTRETIKYLLTSGQQGAMKLSSSSFIKPSSQKTNAPLCATSSRSNPSRPC